MLITGRFGECFTKSVSAVVIADHQVDRHGQARQDLRRLRVGERIAVVSQVSTHDAESRVAVLAADLRNASLQAFARTKPMQFQPGWNEMKVGPMYERQHLGLPQGESGLLRITLR